MSVSSTLNNSIIQNKIIHQYSFKTGISESSLNFDRVIQSDFVHCFGSVRLFEKEGLVFPETLLSSIFSNLNLKDLATKEVLQAAFIKKNPILLKQAMKFFDKVFLEIFTQLQTADKNTEKLLEITLGKAISLIPFFEAKTGTKFNIPQKIDGQYRLVEYKVDQIKLTPDILGSNIFAYGLKPTSDNNARPIISFMGTPHATCSGAFLARFFDFIPFLGVGEGLYYLSKDIITSYIDTAYNEHGPIKAYGISLGGAMVLLAKAHQPEKIEAKPYNPAGVKDRIRKVYQKNKGLNNPKTTVVVHENDKVPKVGRLFKDSEYLKVLSTKNDNIYLSHVKPLSNLDNIAVIKGDVNKENNFFSRYIYSSLHFLVCFPKFMLSSLILLVKVLINLIIEGYKVLVKKTVEEEAIKASIG